MSLTKQQLSEMSPWDIAKHYGIGYNGDMNPIDHGGFFYDFRDWASDGYARIVEFWLDPETGNLMVQQGTVNKPDDDEEMEAAFRSFGQSVSDNIFAQIEAVRAHCGMEPEGTAHPFLKSFKLDDWRECNIWKSVKGWIEDLGK